MTDTTAIYTTVAAPTVPARPFGLFSVAAPTPITDPHELIGVTWESIACGDTPGVTNDPCIVDMGVDPDLVKAERDGCGEWRETKPYTVYVNARRSAIDGDVEERAEAILTQGEQYAAEAGLWDTMAAALAAPVENDSLLEVLANVEQMLALDYRGLGVIHMPVRIASILGDQLDRQGQQLQTKIGTPVVVGAGYDDVETIYGTGVVVVRRGVIDTHPSLDRGVNTRFALAERTYVVAWDCVLVGASIATP